jgi:hypothetical protein
MEATDGLIALRPYHGFAQFVQKYWSQLVKALISKPLIQQFFHISHKHSL